MAKPTPWAFDKTELSSAHESIFDKATAVIPLWENSGMTVTDLKSGATGQIVDGPGDGLGPSWGTDVEGVHLSWPDTQEASGRYVEFSGTALNGLFWGNTTIVAVARPRGVPADDGDFVNVLLEGANESQYIKLGVRDDSGDEGHSRFRIRSDDGQATLNAAQYSTVPHADGTVRVFAARRDASVPEIQLRVDGVLEGTTAETGTDAGVAVEEKNGIFLGDTPGLTEQLYGGLYAVYLFHDVALSDAELSVLEQDPYGLFRQQQGRPPAVSDLSGAGATGAVTCTWTTSNPAADDLSSEELHRTTTKGLVPTPGDATTLVTTLSSPTEGAAQSYTDDGSGALSAPVGGTEYQYTVLSIDTEGKHAASNEASAVPLTGGVGIQFAWHGAVTETGFAVVCEPDGAGTVEFVVSDESTFATEVDSDTQSGAVDAPIRFEASGLSSGTTYYWRVDGGTGAQSGSLTTFPASATTFTVAFGSCTDDPQNSGTRTSNGPTWGRIEARSPDLFLHLGDLHYQDNETTDLAVHRQAYRDVLAEPNARSLFQSVPWAYATDDHEFGPNNSNRTDIGANAWPQVFRDTMPHYPLPETNPSGHTGQSFALGPVRILLLDNRTQRDPQSDTDDATKTMLGAAQKTWLKEELSTLQEEYVMINAGVPWIGDAGTDDDIWAGYSTERAEIAQHIEDEGLSDSVFFIAGDMHALAYDDGTNNDYIPAWSEGGPPVLHAAPLDNSNSTKGGPYTTAPVTASERQYGVIEMTDLGGSLDVTFRGMSVQSATTETEEFAQTFVLSGANSLVDTVNIDGLPVSSGQAVAVRRDETGTIVESATTPIASNGQFAFRGLAGGTYDVYAVTAEETDEAGAPYTTQVQQYEV